MRIVGGGYWEPVEYVPENEDEDELLNSEPDEDETKED